MSNEAAKLIAAGLFALALAHFLTGLHTAVPMGTASGVLVVNTVTGSVKYCAPARGCAAVADELQQ